MGRGPVPEIYSPGTGFTPGRAVLLRSGADASIIACGETVHHALRAAELLARDGIDASVYDMFPSTAKPSSKPRRQALSLLWKSMPASAA